MGRLACRILVPVLVLTATARADPPPAKPRARSDKAVSLCEMSQWGLGYRAGCADMCTLMTVPLIADAEELGEGVVLERAQQHCSAHCYDFCIDQVELLERRDAVAPEHADDE